MRTTQCPKCGGKDLRESLRSNPRARLQITFFRWANVRQLICVNCGYVETYVAEQHLKTIAENWKSRPV